MGHPVNWSFGSIGVAHFCARDYMIENSDGPENTTSKKHPLRRLTSYPYNTDTTPKQYPYNTYTTPIQHTYNTYITPYSIHSTPIRHLYNSHTTSI